MPRWENVVQYGFNGIERLKRLHLDLLIACVLLISSKPLFISSRYKYTTHLQEITLFEHIRTGIIKLFVQPRVLQNYIPSGAAGTPCKHGGIWVHFRFTLDARWWLNVSIDTPSGLPWFWHIWQNGKIQWSGQIIMFHQPRFPWNKGISLPKRYLLGAQVVWGRYNLTRMMGGISQNEMNQSSDSVHSPETTNLQLPGCGLPKQKTHTHLPNAEFWVLCSYVLFRGGYPPWN